MDYKGIAVEAIKNTAEEMLGESIESEDLGEKKSPIEVENFAIIVGLAGQIAGQLVFGFTEEMVFKIARKMIQQEVMELDELTLSAIAEFANVLSGHVTMDLVEAGSKRLGMSPPSIVMGKDLKISTKIQPIEKININMKEYGNMSLHIALKEKKEGGIR